MATASSFTCTGVPVRRSRDLAGLEQRHCSVFEPAAFFNLECKV